jgi:xanthine dehydrogenase accessory factor
MNQQLLDTAQRWHAQGRAAVVVEVMQTKGSVPRGDGTRMLVAADEVVGTIGGGHLELQAIADARRVLTDQAAAHDRHVALGPSLGQCCGGALDLRFSLLTHQAPESWVLPPPRFTLLLFGAGHVGRAIAALLLGIHCRVRWIDEREDEFPSSASPVHIQRLCVDGVHAEVAAAPPGAFYLVLTHSHDTDMQIAQAILQRADFGFFGLIGSKTKRARFEHRLQERGIAAPVLARMVCPIGLAGISGKEPEVIAVAVVAQLLAVASAAGR